VADLYPPVKQFETMVTEAEQQAQLQLERRMRLLRSATRKPRTWRARARAFAMRLRGHAGNDERVNPQACAERGDS